MKKKYIEPEMEISLLEGVDIVTTSGGANDQPGTEGGFPEGEENTDPANI